MVEEFGNPKALEMLTEKSLHQSDTSHHRKKCSVAGKDATQTAVLTLHEEAVLQTQE